MSELRRRFHKIPLQDAQKEAPVVLLRNGSLVWMHAVDLNI
jgi:hypothetical protein